MANQPSKPKIYKSLSDAPGASQAMADFYKRTRQAPVNTRTLQEMPALREGNTYLGPDNIEVSESVYNNPIVRDIWQKRGVNLYQPNNQVEQYAINRGGAGYWDDPTRVARYHNWLRTKPPTEQTPAWINEQQINEAYEILKWRNGGEDWTKWKRLNDQDPLVEYLRQIPAPDNTIVQYQPEQMRQVLQQPKQQDTPIGRWKDLLPSQQFWLSLTAPQSGLQDRPEWSRATASGTLGVISGLGGAGLGSVAGGLIGGAIGSLPGAAVGAKIGGLIGGAVGVGGSIYQNYTEQEVPVLNDVLTVMDWLAIATERSFGLGELSKSKDWDEILQNFQSAWRAGDTTYDAGFGRTVGNAAIYGLSQVIDPLFGYQPAEKPEENEVYDLLSGNSNPVAIAHGKYGPDVEQAVRETYERILQKPDNWQETVYDVQQRYKFSGALGDLFVQSVADPLNFVPFITAKMGMEVGKWAGNERLAMAMESKVGNPLIDALPPGIQEVVSWATKQKGSEGFMSGIDEYADMIRRGEFAPGTKPVAAAELTRFEKLIAGLDEQGRIQELEPQQKQGLALGQLTPESKAAIYANTLMTNLSAVGSAADSAEELIELYYRMANIDPKDAAVAESMAETFEGIEAVRQSPAAASVVEGLRTALQNDATKSVVENWQNTQAIRAKLEELAAGLGIKTGEFLEQLTKSPDQLARRVQQLTGLETTADNLAAIFEPFIGDDAMPWSLEEFKAVFNNAIEDRLTDYLTTRYNLKPDSAFFRFMNMMKAAQGLLVLNTPSYLLNNAISNSVHRAAEGIMGYMTPRQVESFFNRFGVESAEQRGAGETISRTATRAQSDALQKMINAVNTASDKIGVFKNWSGKLEESESRLARMIGTSQYWNRIWKPGKGFRRMPQQLEAALNSTSPGLTERIYDAVSAGMNMDEIEKALFQSNLAPTAKRIVRMAAEEIMPENPDALEGIFSDTGMTDKLQTMINNGMPATQAVDVIEENAQEYVDRMHNQQLIDRANTVRELISTDEQKASLAEILSIFGDMEMEMGKAHVRMRMEWESLYKKYESYDRSQWSKMVSSMFARQDREWRRLFENETQTVAGIIQAIGIETPESQQYVTRLAEIHNIWKEYHKYAREQRKKFFNSVFKTKEERNQAYAALIQDLAGKYEEATTNEGKSQLEMDKLFASMYAGATGWSEAYAQQIRRAIFDLRSIMTSMQKEQREKTSFSNVKEKSQEYQVFNPQYNKVILQIKQLEQLGAWALQYNAFESAGISPEQLASMNAEQMLGMINQLMAAQGKDQPLVTPDMVQAAQQANIDQTVDETTAQATQQEADELAAANAEAMTEEEAIAAAAIAETAEMEQQRQEILTTAADYGITDKSGKVVEPYALNVINRHRRDNGLEAITSLAETTQEEAMAAFQSHLDKHPEHQARAAATAKLNAEDIAALASKQVREAKIREAGMLGRQQLYEDYKQALSGADSKVTPEQLALAFAFLDTVADNWANGVFGTHNEATRDAFYATHYAGAVNEGSQRQLENLYQVAQAPWYYSQLEQVVQKMPEKIEPMALKGFLKGKVKEAELDWSGLDRLITTLSTYKIPSVTKKEIQTFLKATKIDVEEHFYNDNKTAYMNDVLNESFRYHPGIEEWFKKLEAVGIDVRRPMMTGSDNTIYFLDTNTGEDVALERLIGKDYVEAPVDFVKTIKRIEQHMRPVFGEAGKHLFSTKYDDYVIDGDDYTELVLTLKKPEQLEYYPGMQEFMDKAEAKYGLDGWVYELTPEERAQYGRLKAFSSAYEWHMERMFNSRFESSHWEEYEKDTPVLAHVRFVTETDEATGRRTLKVDEFQSDWSTSIRQDADTEKGPLVDRWEELAVKKIIQYAAENGYDRVAWIGGKTHAERWGTELIQWKTEPDGYITLTPYDYVKGDTMTPQTPDLIRFKLDKDDTESALSAIEQAVESAVYSYGWSRKRLQDHINKISDKILSRLLAGEESGSVKPREEGLISFYNNVMPNIVRKMVNKYGASVEEVNTGSMQFDPALDYYNVYYEDGSIARSLAPLTDKSIEYMKSLGVYTFEKVKNPIAEDANTEFVFNITPAMRDTALNRGFALFQDQATMPIVQDAIAPWYFSQLERTLQTMPNKMTAQALEGFLRGKVKTEEMYWPGLDELIKAKKEQGESVTRQELLDFISQNKIKLEVEQESEYVLSDDMVDHFRKANENYNYLVELLEEKGIYPVFEDYLGALSFNLDGYRDESRFTTSDLWRLKNRFNSTILSDDVMEAVEDIVSLHHNLIKEEMKKIRVLDYSDMIIGGYDYRHLFIKLPEEYTQGREFETSHFRDKKNILSHVRITETFTENGERALIVNEMQSDWHQRGKKYGYITDKLEAHAENLRQRRIELGEEIGEKSILLQGDIESEEDAVKTTNELASLLREQNDIIEEYRRISSTLVSGATEAPFSNSWEEMTIKQIIRYAAENGYDAVAFPATKEQVAKIERWPDASLDEANADMFQAIIDRYIVKVPSILRKLTKKAGGELGTVEIEAKSGEIETLAALTITPELKKTALHDGFALFSAEGKTGPKAAMTKLDNGRVLFRALNAPDFSSLVHEMFHSFVDLLEEPYLNALAEMGGYENAQAFKDADGKFWRGELDEAAAAQYRKTQETFARGGEQYLTTGQAPTPRLKALFRKFQEWMLNIYTSLKQWQNRIAGWENYAAFDGIDIKAKVNGISLSDIYDSLLVSNDRKPKSFDALVNERAEKLRDTRMAGQPEAQIIHEAKQQVAREITQKAGPEATSLELDEYITLDDGSLVDEATILEANDWNQRNPSLFQEQPGETDNFKAWWKDSKVVDEEGNPLVVYHGSPTGGFEAFSDAMPKNKNQQIAFGIHFTPVKETAARYADGSAKIGNKKPKKQEVYEVYLSIQNPLLADQIVKEGSPEYELAKKLAGRNLTRISAKDENGIPAVYLQRSIDQTSPEKALKIIKEAGYDGIRYDAEYITPTGYGMALDNREQSWVVFEPTQIKAVGNQGQWNPNDPRILYQGEITPEEIKNGYNNGAMINLQDAIEAEVKLTHKQKAPISEAAQSLMENAKSMPKELRQTAVSIVEAIINHQSIEDIETDDPYLIDYVRTALAELPEYHAAIEEADKPALIDPTVEAPATGTYVAKTYLYKHGKHNIVAIVYRDGFEVAYLPATSPRVEPFEASGTQAIMLGVDPSDPETWLYEVDGELHSVNADKPQMRSFDAEPAQPQPKPQPEQTIEQPSLELQESTGPEGLYAFSVVNPEKTYYFTAKIVDLKDLVASHHHRTLKPNDGYPLDMMQNRDRSRKASEAQINDIVKQFNPRKVLIDQHSIITGPMIVLPDNKVASGNGRVMAMLRILEDHPDKWQAYQAALKRELPYYGLSEADLQGVENPVLVRVAPDDIDVREFVEDANEKETAGLSNMEKAAQDAKHLQFDLVSKLEVGDGQTLEQALRSRTNDEFVNKLLQTYNTNEKAEILDANGEFSSDGMQRFKRALFLLVYPGETGERILARTTESGDESPVKRIESAMFTNLPRMASMESLIQEGKRSQELSIVEDISAAIDMLARLRATRQSVEAYLAQVPLGGESELTPTQRALLGYFHKYGSKSAKAVADLLNGYTNNVINVQQNPDQLAMLPTSTKEEILVGIVAELGKKIDIESEEKKLEFFTQPEPEPEPEPAQNVTRTPMPIDPVTTPNREQADPYSETLDEVSAEFMRPTLDSMREKVKKELPGSIMGSAIPESQRKMMQAWLNQVKGDMASAKYASIKHGDLKKSAAMLNYSRKYGFDTMLNLVVPYQFWYTRSMMRWLQRVFDKPQWYAFYGKLREMQKKLAATGLPSRLKDKMRIPAPYLPEWMGGNIWIDPYKALFPPASFAQPFEQYSLNRAQVKRRAESILQDLVDTEEITMADMDEALQMRSGTTWDRAVKQAEAELDQSGSPASLVTMMLQPAMYLTLPYQLATGRADKISPMPITKTAQNIRTATKGTMLQPVGDALGMFALPEEALRKKANLSEYGEWGTYYIDRHLANLAADGEISADAAKRAMIERSGPAYDMAIQRVQQEMMLRTPGASTLRQLAQGDVKGAIQSLPNLFFGATIYPEGELELRGLKEKYDQAWRNYTNGDKQAINAFFEEYPEYEARLALFDEPEERLRQMLVSEIWDRYTKLPSINRREAADQLGEEFKARFLDKETRNYDGVDVRMLSMWAQALGSDLPKTEETQPVIDQPGEELQLYDDPIAQAVDHYRAQREQLYPGITSLSAAYYDLDKAERRRFLAQFPRLKEYWKWKDEYEAQNPLVAAYNQDQADKQQPIMTPREFQMVTPPLRRQLDAWSNAGTPLTKGANSELLRIWQSTGKRTGSFQTWMDEYVWPTFAGW